MSPLFRSLGGQLPGTKIIILPILLLAMVLVALLVVFTDSLLQWSIWEFAGLLLLALVVMVPVLMDLFSERQTDLFRPLYTISFIFFIAFIVSPVVMLVEGWVGVRNNDFRQQLAKASLVVTVGLLGFFAGYLFLQSRMQDENDPAERTLLGRPIYLQRGFVLALGAFFVSAALFYLWTVTANLPLAYLNVLEDSISYGQQSAVARGGTLYMFLFRLSWPLLVLMIYYVAPNRFWKGVAALSWLAVLAVYILAANRSNLLIFLTSTIVIYFLRHNRRPGITHLIAIIGLFIFLSGFLVSARGFGGIPDDVRYLEEFTTEITDRGAATGLMGTVSVFPDKHRYLGLTALSDVIYAPIPRALWPGKPSLRPVQDVLNSNLPSRAHAPGVIGVFYAAAGFAGPFFILMIYGAVSAYLFENWRQNKGNLVAQLLLAGWLPFLWVIIHRGVLSKHIVETLYRFGPILAVYFLARVSKKDLEAVDSESDLPGIG